MEKHMLITISRQFGSGGREVSKILAKKLGVRRYDKKIVEMAADNIEEGMDPKEAYEKNIGTYGRFSAEQGAVKYIDPREE